MPRRATRSANCHRDVADSSVALPKDRMPWAYSERASSHRRRSSTSPSGKRRLRATESGTCRLMLMVLLKVYAVGPAHCKATSVDQSTRPTGKRRHVLQYLVDASSTCVQPVGSRLRPSNRLTGTAVWCQWANFDTSTPAVLRTRARGPSGL